jgi:tetratricopeptide (TPR) repeat protein
LVNDRDFNALQSEVQDVRRRVDELTTQNRKMEKALSSLADSVGKVVASARKRERRVSLNSFVAYCLFTVLLGGGFFMLYQSRASKLVGERNHAVQSRDAARQKVAELQTKVQDREKASAAAYDYWKLLRDGKRSEAISRYSKVELSELSPTERELFSAGVKKARAEMVDAGYLSGLDSYRRNNFAKAATDLRRALAYEAEGSRAAQMRYYLGVAQYKMGKHGEAVRQLELALAGGAKRAGISDARFYLAAALEQRGDFEEARAQYDKFASANPKHSLAVAARRKSAALARKATRTN